MYPPLQHQATSRPWTEEDLEFVATYLTNFVPGCPLQKIASCTAPPSTTSIIDDVLLPTILKECNGSINSFLLKTHVPHPVIGAVEFQTRGQSSNVNWHKVRKLRFSASLFHTILHSSSLTPSLVASLSGNNYCLQ